MKAKKLLLLIPVILALGLGLFLAGHVFVDGSPFPRKARVFDLTGHDLTVEEYLQLQEQYPDTQILWTVPFQGSRYPTDTKTLTVTTLTEEDVAVLDHLPLLEQMDATGCADYDALKTLQQRHPQCRILYTLWGAPCSSTDTALTILDADPRELEAGLALLPNVTAVTLEGRLPPAEDLLALGTAFPAVQFRYTLSIAGLEFPSDTERLDLSGTAVTAAQLQETLPLMTHLREITLTETTLSDSQLKSLIRQFPDLFFRCALDFAGVSCATDAVLIDLSGRTVTSEEVDEMLPFFPNLEKLDLSGCGIGNEEMDALNRRHPDVSIVWTVRIGWLTLRTDAAFYYPGAYRNMEIPGDEELAKLRYCTEMVAVDIGHSGATNCEWARYMPRLKYLILADTKVTDLSPLSGCKELVYLEVFSTRVTDYSPLLGCTALQDLNIGTTFGDAEPLSQMTWLHTLFWNRCLQDPVIAEKAILLEEQLPDTIVILDSGKNTGTFWRYLPNYYVFREIIGAEFFDQEFIRRYWDEDTATQILGCNQKAPFAANVLARIVRDRIDNRLPIVGIPDGAVDKAEALYQSLLNSSV